MAIDLNELRAAVSEHGKVTRIVIAAIRGSSPREIGAAMLVWPGGQSGTIGGGALEYEATTRALRQEENRVLTTHSLGPQLGQCCGGAVTLLSETFGEGSLPIPEGDVVARPTSGGTDMPLSVKRLVSALRSRGTAIEAQLVDGWMVEPVYRPSHPVWIWGAGHVGRALVDVLAPMPDVELTWVDTSPDRFPADMPDGVSVVPTHQPAELVRHAPANADHIVVTYSHALDLELCNRLLQHDFHFAGLIGSATKWARFRARLVALGHPLDRVARINSPIGDPALGKHPQAIAVGVAADLLRRARSTDQHDTGFDGDQQDTEQKDIRA